MKLLYYDMLKQRWTNWLNYKAPIHSRLWVIKDQNILVSFSQAQLVLSKANTKKIEASIPIPDEHNPIVDSRQKPITRDSNIHITIHNVRT
jgi:hypothetical protein